MGAIVAILGEAGDPELSDRLQRMLVRSPYRGAPKHLVEGPLAIGIQSMGWDASLADAGNWLVAFHGYIGNWAELAAERGWRFEERASNADKIAVAYEDLGERLFAKLRGEWALLIWDRRERTLLAARDLIGCRPLFRQAFGGRAFFATEVRQVLAGSEAAAEIDIETFRRSLNDEPNRVRSSIRGVFQVPAGGIWERYDDHDACREESFSCLGREWPELGRVGLEEAAEIVRTRLEVAVARASAARPMGVALSGGLDSSTVWGILRNQGPIAPVGPGITSFCLRYPGRDDDEGEFMEAVLAHRTGARSDIQMRPEMVRPSLEEAAGLADTPYLGNIICQIELARTAGDVGKRILLTGHGGDHAFDGNLNDLEQAIFNDHDPSAALWAVRLALGQRMLGRAGREFVRVLAGRTKAAPSSYGANDGNRAASELSTEAHNLWSGTGEALVEAGRRTLLEYLVMEQAGWNLTPWEQVGAAFGVEMRHPLLDLDLLESALSIPQKLHLARGFRKGLLRVAAAPHLPKKVRSRRGKMVLSDFLTEGISHGAGVRKTRGGTGEHAEIVRRFEAVSAGFNEEFVVPLYLLIDGLVRRG